jgi:hypothetical protein
MFSVNELLLCGDALVLPLVQFSPFAGKVIAEPVRRSEATPPSVRSRHIIPIASFDPTASPSIFPRTIWPMDRKNEPNGSHKRPTPGEIGNLYLNYGFYVEGVTVQ